MKKPLLSELTVKEKIGQLLMLHGPWQAYGPAPTKPKEINEQLVKEATERMLLEVEKYQPGTFWLDGIPRMSSTFTFAEDKAIADLISSKVKYPMLFGDDSEEGMPGHYLDRTMGVGALSKGAANDTDLTYKIDKGICAENRAAGKNWRWSPVIDIPHRLNLGTLGRSVSDDIDTIVKHATAAIEAGISEGVATTLKHFPGDDPFEIRDGHFVTPVINASFEDWYNGQGQTFKRMIDAGALSIMSTHTAFPAIDDEKLGGMYVPATISKKISTNLLRGKLGFKGVLVTDDMAMGGFGAVAPREELIIRAVNAGNDVLLNTKAEDVEIIYRAVEDGRIPMSRIDESCQRVLDMKEKIGLFNDEKPACTPAPEAKKMINETAKEISEKALTLLYDRNELIPASKERIKSVAIVFISHAEWALSRMDVLKREFESRGATAKVFDCIDLDNRDEIFTYDLILYVGYMSQHNPMGLPSFSGRQIKSFFHAFTNASERSIGISVGYPYLHFDCMVAAGTFVNAYSIDDNTLIGLVKGIYGEIPFVGKSPVDIEPKLRYVYC